MGIVVSWCGVHPNVFCQVSVLARPVISRASQIRIEDIESPWKQPRRTSRAKPGAIAVSDDGKFDTGCLEIRFMDSDMHFWD